MTGLVWRYAAVWFRAWSIVCCTSANVRYVSSGRVLAMFLTGCLLSAIWWANARAAAHSPLRGAGLAYALGAGCGTVSGWFIAGLI